MKTATQCLCLLSLFCFLITSSCRTSDINTVKKGTFPGHPTAKIEDLLHAVLENVAWETFRSTQGETIVECTGTVSQQLHDIATDRIMEQAMVNITQAFTSNDPFALLTIANQAQTLSETIGNHKEQMFLQRLQQQNLPKEVRDLSLLYAFTDANVYPVGEEITLQWTKNLTDNTFALSYIGGAFDHEQDSGEILAILCDQPLLHLENEQLHAALIAKMDDLFSHRQFIRQTFADILQDT